MKSTCKMPDKIYFVFMYKKKVHVAKSETKRWMMVKAAKKQQPRLLPYHNNQIETIECIFAVFCVAFHTMSICLLIQISWAILVSGCTQDSPFGHQVIVLKTYIRIELIFGSCRWWMICCDLCNNRVPLHFLSANWI